MFPLWAMVCLAVAVIVHELTHAAAAWGLGVGVTHIQLGSGNLWCELLVRGVRWQIRGLPFSGRVILEVKKAAGSRIRWILVVAAGPLANLVLAGVGIWVGYRQSWYFTDFDMALVGSNLFCVLMSLWHAEHLIQGEKQMSDGLLIAFLCKAPGEWFDLIGMEAACVASHGQNAEPKVFERLNMLGAMIDGDRYKRTLEKYIMHFRVGSDERVKYLDHLCTWALFTGDRRLAADVEPYCRELFEARGQERTIQGTRGSLLVVTGRMAEGVEMLEVMMADDEAPLDRAIGGCTLAWAAHQRGDYQARDRWRADGWRSNAGERVVDWMERAMDGQAA